MHFSLDPTLLYHKRLPADVLGTPQFCKCVFEAPKTSACRYFEQSRRVFFMPNSAKHLPADVWGLTPLREKNKPHTRGAAAERLPADVLRALLCKKSRMSKNSKYLPADVWGASCHTQNAQHVPRTPAGRRFEHFHIMWG